MKRHWLLIGTLIFLSVVAILGVLSFSRNSAPQEFQVRRGNIHLVVVARGKVEPYAEIQIGAKTTERIKAILVKEGDLVQKGQVIALLDDEELRAQLEQAKAHVEEAKARLQEVEAGPREQELEASRAKHDEAKAVLDEAKATVERFSELLKEGAISQAQFDEANRRYWVAAAQHRSAKEQLSLLEAGTREEVKRMVRAQVKRAEADLRHVQAMLQNTMIKVPVSGKIVRKHMDVGEVTFFLDPRPIVTLADMSRVQVRAEIDETDVRKVKVGQETVVTSDAYPGKEFRGTVIEIGTMVGKKSIRSEKPAEMLDTKVLEAQIELPRDTPLKLGLTVDVKISAVEKNGVLIVPRQVIREEGGERFVIVKANGSYTARKIVTGVEDDEFVEILSDLKEGEVVLVKS
ncbi:MAG: efflux RND transporter periplasmic adaptor subunit [candidate division NC10 bacterium]|nr:efflux RND transporter periplasmic adaptor subunit [candidate division NC10 bacterium]